MNRISLKQSTFLGVLGAVFSLGFGLGVVAVLLAQSVPSVPEVLDNLSMTNIPSPRGLDPILEATMNALGTEVWMPNHYRFETLTAEYTEVTRSPVTFIPITPNAEQRAELDTRATSIDLFLTVATVGTASASGAFNLNLNFDQHATLDAIETVVRVTVDYNYTQTATAQATP